METGELFRQPLLLLNFCHLYFNFFDSSGYWYFLKGFWKDYDPKKENFNKESAKGIQNVTGLCNYQIAIRPLQQTEVILEVYLFAVGVFQSLVWGRGPNELGCSQLSPGFWRTSGWQCSFDNQQANTQKTSACQWLKSLTGCLKLRIEAKDCWQRDGWQALRSCTTHNRSGILLQHSFWLSKIPREWALPAL